MQFRYSMSPLAARFSLRPSPFRKIWQLIFQRTGLAYGLNRLVEALLKTPEPKVVWKSDRYGEPYLEVYDPETKASHYFTSEQDALIWLERRFQQFL
jgi:hypothetical protein